MPSRNVLIGEAFLNVPAGAHSYAVFHWTASPKWTHGIYVVVDQSNRIAEASENNNLAFRNIYVFDLPDLSIAASNTFSVPSAIYQGVSVIVRAVVINLGEAPVTSFLVRFLEGGVMFYDSTVSVDGEENVSAEASWTPQYSGSRNISVSIDPLGAVSESSRSNNVAHKAFNVAASPTVPGTSTTTTLPPCYVAGCGASCQDNCNAQWSAGSCVLDSVMQCLASCPACPGDSSTTSSTTASSTSRPVSTTTTSIVFPPLPTDPTTTTLSESCLMPGNSLPCNEVTLAEVVSGITAWANGAMQLNDVIALINSWADQSSYPPV